MNTSRHVAVKLAANMQAGRIAAEVERTASVLALAVTTDMLQANLQI